jgi:hypothetical protein
MCNIVARENVPQRSYSCHQDVKNGCQAKKKGAPEGAF